MFAQESVMGIQEENNLIQEAFEVEADEVGFCLDQKWGDYENPYENSDTALAFNLFKKGWQAAAAQAVPEGFVILKASDVREILSNASDAMDAESPSSVFTQTGIPSTWYDHHLVAEKNILDAIKAQEPTND